jgi:iron(II)-dependent oxidoreductase
LMHAETFAYILHQLDYGRKIMPALPPEVGTAGPRQSRMVEIPAGTAQLGLDSESAFGWDNEFQSLAVDVPAFSIAQHKVANGEYLEFVRAGAAPPFFWVEHAGRWFYRGMFAEIPLPLDWPVYVMHSEAEAYAKWRGGALPTEAQFHRAASFHREASFHSEASVAHDEPQANLDFKRWDPVPVHTGGNHSSAPSQLAGNGWEWTSTVFAPFPGFTPFPFYTNYSEPFFDGQHYVLKGASPRTAARLARPSFRNWFRPSYPYIYATFRLVDL